MRSTLASIFVIVAFISVTAVSAQWLKQDVATTASFRGLSVVNEKVIWASGTGGTVIRTIDGGKKWDVIQVPDAAKLDFRDIEAFDANTAYILSIGNGESSRIYKTTDGGKNWKEQFRNKNEKAFFDAIACWTAKRCIAMSDPVDRHYLLIETLDGGATWNEIKSDDLPAAKDGQAAFAASGTCLITQGSGGMAYLVSGGTDAIVYRSYDYGRKWAAASTPIVKGTQGSGIFSIAMWNGKAGFIVGGNYEKPNEKTNVAASTSDGARTWKAVEGLSGYRSAVAYIDANTLIAVGTNGTDVSFDGGRTWRKTDDEALNSVQSKCSNSIWAVGPNGVVVRNIWQRSTNGSGHPPNVTGVKLSHDKVVACTPNPTENCGNANVTVYTSSPEIVEPHKLNYRVSGGRIIGSGSTVAWDMSGLAPGKYLITVELAVPYLYSWAVFGKTETRVVTVIQ